MKKIAVIFLLMFSLPAFSYEVYDAEWCRKNGGRIEFDFEYNINFNCITRDVKNVPYAKKLYNIACIPCFSSIINKEEPLFLKVVGEQESLKKNMFDVYNWKITEDEMTKYI